MLPDAPSIPGLRFRPMAGASDADPLFTVYTACVEIDGIDPLAAGERVMTHEDFAESLATLAQDGGDRALLAEIYDRAAGYNRLYDWIERDGTHVWLNVGRVAPEWRGRGLGTALLRWSERRTRELAAGSELWEFAANASSTETEATALLLDHGYRVAYTVLEMGLDWSLFRPAALALPTGVEIRPATIEHAARIATSIDESYAGEYEGGRYSERFDPEAYAVALAGKAHDPGLWRVAWVGDEVVGQVIPVIERGRAEIDEVSVRPGWRRGGVARALLSDALMGLRERGIDVVRLNTVAEFRTRAMDLYESLGFRVLKRFPRYRKPPQV